MLSTRILSIVAILSAVLSQGVAACIFCTPQPTLSELVAESDGVALVRWLDGKPAGDENPGESRYEVIQPLKSGRVSLKQGDQIKVPRYRDAKPGNLFLLAGKQGEKGDPIEWSSPVEITDAGFQYLAKSPPADSPAEKRLPYYLDFLEHPETAIANDAYGEFANAPYKDVLAIVPKLSREKLRGWIENKKTPQTRLGLYGMLLGHCGNDDDAKLLAEKVSPNPQDGTLRLGIDGMIAGYLLIAGDKGLDRLDEWKFTPAAKAPPTEIYAAMQALRFIWQYTDGKVGKPRQQQSMRLLLDQPDVADLAITDLARMGDWSVQDALVERYGKGDYDKRAVTRAILGYLIAGTKAKPAADAKGADPAKSAKAHLEALRKKDPKAVQNAERFLLRDDRRPHPRSQAALGNARPRSSASS